MGEVNVELQEPTTHPSMSGTPSPPLITSPPLPATVGYTSTPQQDGKSSLRAPKCTRCRNHGIVSDLRGHKHKCFWRDCTCTKCLISSDRQRATADRIALFRQQVRQLTAADRRQRNKRQHSNEETPNFSQASSMPVSPRRLPPTLPKMPAKVTSPFESKMQQTPPYWSERETDFDKNIDILRQIFPFYDLNSLDVISRENKNDLLQTVLAISARLLEKRQAKSDFCYFTLPPSSHHHAPFSKMMSTGRCCSSPYCPINSYLNLRQKSPEIMQHLPTPPLTANSTYDRDIQNTGAKQAKRFRFSTDTELPYCEACKKFGTKGDKFCPLCGILF